MYVSSLWGSSRSWVLAGALLAVLMIGTGRAQGQAYAASMAGARYAYPAYSYAQPYRYAAPYTYAPTYRYTYPYAGTYTYTTPSVAPVYGYNNYTVGSSPTMAGYRYLDDYAAGRGLPLAKPRMAPLK